MPVVYIYSHVPTVIYIIDMVFNKLLFRYKHLVLVLFIAGCYYGIIVLRTVILPHEIFPS